MDEAMEIGKVRACVTCRYNIAGESSERCQHQYDLCSRRRDTMINVITGRYDGDSRLDFCCKERTPIDSLAHCCISGRFWKPRE